MSTSGAQLPHRTQGIARRIAKRTLDVVVSATLLIVCSPVMLVAALLIWMRMGRPVMFRQLRPGQFHRPFTVLKFRTMSNARDAAGALLPDSARLLPLGLTLRRLSIDELPQLWNVLRGDMSLVGPRPLLMEYLPLYNQFQERRHLVRPGITGWAQVNGRNATTWTERFANDVYYVEHQTFGFDLKILLRTVACVMRRDGISAKDESTMPKFTGNAE